MNQLVVFVVLGAWVSTTLAINCVPCDTATCIPPPPGCELGRRVCSCCEECRVKEGGQCGAFSVECESHLVCFTNQGVFVGRPPVDSHAQGRCISYQDIPSSPAAPQPRSGNTGCGK